jgi:hypothetical protein
VYTPEFAAHKNYIVSEEYILVTGSTSSQNPFSTTTRVGGTENKSSSDF